MSTKSKVKKTFSKSHPFVFTNTAIVRLESRKKWANELWNNVDKGAQRTAIHSVIAKDLNLKTNRRKLLTNLGTGSSEEDPKLYDIVPVSIINYQYQR